MPGPGASRRSVMVGPLSEVPAAPGVWGRQPAGRPAAGARGARGRAGLAGGGAGYPFILFAL